MQARMDAYVRWWRTSGTSGVPALFTLDAPYLGSAYEEPVVGRAALSSSRTGPRAVPFSPDAPVFLPRYRLCLLAFGGSAPV